MNMKTKTGWIMLMLLVAVMYASAQPLQDNFYVKVLHEELQRNIKRLKLPDLERPFFIAYNLSNHYNLELNAERGIITSTVSGPVNRKVFAVKLRVGDYHRNFDYMINDVYSVLLPHEEDADEYRRLIWLETDKAYKNNARQYTAFMSSLKRVNVDPKELALDDLSIITPLTQDFGAATPIVIDTDKWKERLKRLSTLFNEHADITTSYCRLSMNSAEEYLVTSEGTTIRKPKGHVTFTAYGALMQEDGSSISHTYSLIVKDIHELPSFDSLETAVKQLISTLRNKQKAKPFEGSYIGPVLLEGDAVHGIIQSCFTSNLQVKRKPIIGYGMPDVDYEEKLGQKLVASALTVTAIPSLKVFEGKKTTGAYEVDNEGVRPPDSLVLIQHGVLRSLLNGRTPTHKFPVSQGFSASVFGSNTYSPGVLRLTSDSIAPADSMKSRLLQLAKEEGLPYAYIIKGLRRYGNDTEIYRVNVATGEEEMINECEVLPLNIRSLRRFIVASDKTMLRNYADLSIIAPQSMIINEVEIEKSRNATKPKPFIVSNPLLEPSPSKAVKKKIKK